MNNRSRACREASTKHRKPRGKEEGSSETRKFQARLPHGAKESWPAEGMKVALDVNKLPKI